MAWVLCSLMAKNLSKHFPRQASSKLLTCSCSLFLTQRFSQTVVLFTSMPFMKASQDYRVRVCELILTEAGLLSKYYHSHSEDSSCSANCECADCREEDSWWVRVERAESRRARRWEWARKKRWAAWAWVARRDRRWASEWSVSATRCDQVVSASTFSSATWVTMRSSRSSQLLMAERIWWVCALMLSFWWCSGVQSGECSPWRVSGCYRYSSFSLIRRMCFSSEMGSDSRWRCRSRLDSSLYFRVTYPSSSFLQLSSRLASISGDAMALLLRLRMGLPRGGVSSRSVRCRACGRGAWWWAALIVIQSSKHRLVSSQACRLFCRLVRSYTALLALAASLSLSDYNSQYELTCRFYSYECR